jgi:2-oxoglutarate ferredoxin oxidoreductase subunit gamma
MVRVSDLSKSIKVYSIPATRIAEELGKRMVLNSVMVGFFTAVTHLLDPDAVGKAVADSVPASFRELNLKAFEKGLEYGITALTATANAADAELQEQYSPE